MITRFLFNRVEKWIDNLEPEYRTKGFVQASLGLLRIIGLPTDFSKLLGKDSHAEGRAIELHTAQIVAAEAEKDAHEVRLNELYALEQLLS